ncbi:formate dehydrogenase subunit gamma [Chromobacterium haemolyticum]|uniref:Formate dehydrogenase subunit gamma n=1 Tax=Chromobacterium fluminis TaxID=3044269 RepID=A0ABX0L9H7_9NEIS|nr:formate dehydrogenase subunit gamma [Chromobacterium haemolyticum]NHR06149.1 formate dehydrogenase subunit gamma [Chromobacterium haemolyticum]OQS42648.1 formate dehydrogenase subunit gamma [Chromobacterium haemolyticum]
MSKEKLIKRYSAAERLNHWIVAVCFVLLAISGLAFFYPAFFWLTGVFGTPQLARIIHPFVGVLMFLGFARQFLRYWHHNFLDKEDVKWMMAVKSVLSGHEVGDIGKYNGGQKGMFWLMTGCMLMLVCTGFIMWRPYFALYFPIPVIRVALLLHAWSALILIAGIIVHVYAAIWVRGTIRAMVEGVVTHAWAKKHHPRWYREMTGDKNKP